MGGRKPECVILNPVLPFVLYMRQKKGEFPDVFGVDLVGEVVWGALLLIFVGLRQL